MFTFDSRVIYLNINVKYVWEKRKEDQESEFQNTAFIKHINQMLYLNILFTSFCVYIIFKFSSLGKRLKKREKQTIFGRGEISVTHKSLWEAEWKDVHHCCRHKKDTKYTNWLRDFNDYDTCNLNQAISKIFHPIWVHKITVWGPTGRRPSKWEVQEARGPAGKRSSRLKNQKAGGSSGNRFIKQSV